MVSRRRFNSWNEWNRLLSTATVPLHRPLNREELARGVRILKQWLIGGSVLLLFMLAILTHRMLVTTSPSIAMLQSQMKNKDPMVRERALRIVARDSLYAVLSCTELLVTLIDPDPRVASAAMPTVTGALESGHCSHVLFVVLDSTQSAARRERLLQIISAVGKPLAAAAHRPLLRAIEIDSATGGSAAIAISRTGNGDAQSLRALRAAFRRGTGVARGEALFALLSLEPTCRNIPLVREALGDTDATVRRMAVESLEPIVLDRDAHCAGAQPLIEALTTDTSTEVRAAAVRLLSFRNY